MNPASGSIYIADVTDRGGSMMRALREWEKKRGLTFSFRGKFIEPKPKQQKQQKPKQPKTNEITVPRERRKPGRKPVFTKEERRQRKLENNRLYRKKNEERARERSRQWRANLTPEQRQAIAIRHREWREKNRAAKVQEAAGHP